MTSKEKPLHMCGWIRGFTIPFFESASLVCASVDSFTNLRFAATRLVVGVDSTSPASFLASFTFVGDNGVFFTGDFYGKNIKSVELNRLVIEDTFISFNSTSLQLISFAHGLKLPLPISILRC